MHSWLSDTIFYTLLSRADFLSIGIVSALMLLFMVCVGLFIFQWYLLSGRIARAEQARQVLARVTNYDELRELIARFAKTTVGDLMSAALLPLRTSLGKAQIEQIAGTKLTVITESEKERVALALESTLADLIKQEERWLIVFKTSAEAGPLVGLFGTVWGLIHAFHRIGHLQTADIPTVAPGIAEALLVTLTGLLVAIPALIMYAVLVQKMRALEHNLVSIAQQVEWLVDKNVRESHGTVFSL